MANGRQRFERLPREHASRIDHPSRSSARLARPLAGGRADDKRPSMMGSAFGGLERTIEAEIVPRLMLVHREGIDAISKEPTYALTPPSIDDVAELARLVVAHDESLARDYIEAMRAEGMEIDVVFLELIAPTARLLGDKWLRDECTFTAVTIGASRLHSLVRSLTAENRSEPVPEGNIAAGAPGPDGSAVQRSAQKPNAAHEVPGPRVALVEVPGEEHTLGLHIVREFFRRDGWDVWGAPALDVGELFRLVEDEWISVVGLSMSDAASIPQARKMIGRIRTASLNSQIFVMIGGVCVTEDPTVVGLVGADAGPVDAKEAVAIARSYVDNVGSSRQRH